jgi:transmembrane 9 superfamily protein 1
VSAFRKAVSKEYYFQFVIDDLPVWGFVGKKEDDGTAVLFTDFAFELEYNDNRVISASVATDAPVNLDIVNGSPMIDQVQFTYTVQWKPTKVRFGHRMDRYRKYQFLKQHLEIHWFSILNSFVTVLLLTAVLGTILMRVLKKDIAKYTMGLGDEEDALDDLDESGWKFVHGDVFRFPKHKSLFCALIGTGLQVLVLAFVIFALALVGAFYPTNRGAMLTALIVGYALTAGTAGYTSASYFKQFEGRKWLRNLLLTVTVFCGPLSIVFAINNTVAIAYGSTAALPTGTIFGMLALWLLVATPLTIVGGIVGKNSRVDFAAPCRTNKYPREIPVLPWYRSLVPR